MTKAKKIFLFVGIEIVLFAVAFLSFAMHPGNRPPGQPQIEAARYVYSVLSFPLLYLFPDAVFDHGLELMLIINTLLWSSAIYFGFVRSKMAATSSKPS